MTETPNDDKGYTGEDAADLGRPAEENDVQRAPNGDAANVESQQAGEQQAGESDEDQNG